jgi:hypothetical protein
MKYGWVRWLYLTIFCLGVVAMMVRPSLPASVSNAITNSLFYVIAGTALAVTVFQQWQRRKRDQDQDHG